MNSKKYELTDITKEVDSLTLYRIRALKDFANVKAGELGGYVTDEDCISQTDRSWVYDEDGLVINSKIYGDSSIECRCIIKASTLYNCGIGVRGTSALATIVSCDLDNVDIYGDIVFKQSKLVNCMFESNSNKLKTVLRCDLSDIESNVYDLFLEKCNLCRVTLVDIATLVGVAIGSPADAVATTVTCNKCDYEYEGPTLKLITDKDKLNTADILKLIEEAKVRGKEKDILRDRADTIRNKLE